MKRNYGELEKLFEKIADVIDYVEGADLQSRRNTLFLSNRDKIDYYVSKASIAHLLGVKINYLISTNTFRSTNSFDLLKELCANPYKINKLSNDGIISQEQLFSAHIEQKIDSFKENIKINAFETEFICKYDKRRASYNSSKIENCEYIICKKYKDGKIGIVFLTSDKNGLYVPMSNRIYDDFESTEEDLKELLRGQEITLISGSINTNSNLENDYYKKIVLSPNIKKYKIEKLKKYKEQFICSIDIIDEFKYASSKLTQKSQMKYEDSIILDNIVKSIINGKIMDTNNFQDSMLLSIANAWNDYICNNPNGCNDANSKTYTEIIAELKTAKEIIDRINLENETLKTKVDNLVNENTILTEENSEYKNKEQAIMKILKPEN